MEKELIIIDYKINNIIHEIVTYTRGYCALFMRKDEITEEEKKKRIDYIVTKKIPKAEITRTEDITEKVIRCQSVEQMMSLDKYFRHVIYIDDITGKYILQNFLEGNYLFINELLTDKMLNVLFLCDVKDKFVKEYKREEIKKDFYGIYHIHNIQSNVYSMKTKDGKIDIQSLYEIMNTHPLINYGLVIPDVMDISFTKEVLKKVFLLVNVRVFTKLKDGSLNEIICDGENLNIIKVK